MNRVLRCFSIWLAINDLHGLRFAWLYDDRQRLLQVNIALHLGARPLAHSIENKRVKDSKRRGFTVLSQSVLDDSYTLWNQSTSED